MIPTVRPKWRRFAVGLRSGGWIEGRTIDVAVQWVGDDAIEASAKELVGAKPDVLLSRSTPTTAALNNERGLIPLVFVNVAEPVEQGLVQSFSQPDARVTGDDAGRFGTREVGG
jgi:putative tryptophan/tyrosine transport system substrate-binding protein